jgi:hypothetical protein
VNVKPLPAGYRYNTPIESSAAKMVTTMHHINCERITCSFPRHLQLMAVFEISTLKGQTLKGRSNHHPEQSQRRATNGGYFVCPFNAPDHKPLLRGEGRGSKADG